MKKRTALPKNDEMLGYKIMRHEGGRIISGRDSRLSFPCKVGVVLTMPGKGIYLSTNREYVIENYSCHDDEALLTVSFNPNELITGSLDDVEPDFSVPWATIVDIEFRSATTCHPKASYLGQCNTIRSQSPAGDAFWHEMIQNGQPISQDEFVANCDPAAILDEGETLSEFVHHASDVFFKSRVGDRPVWFIDLNGFEFIFC